MVENEIFLLSKHLWIDLHSLLVFTYKFIFAGYLISIRYQTQIVLRNEKNIGKPVQECLISDL